MKKLIALCAIMALLAYSPVAMAQAIPDKDTTEIVEAAPGGKAFADTAAANVVDDAALADADGGETAAAESAGFHKQLKTKFIEGSAGFMSLVALALVLGLAFCIERIIYLTLSARNDWSSTLPIDDNSFFYWGANVSVVLTDLFPSIRGNVLSFLKLRGGYGQTGNDASPYYTSTYYVLGSATGGFGSLTFPLNSFSGLLQSTRMPATSLRPEISTAERISVSSMGRVVEP